MITISRLYDDYDTAARAVDELERAGIPHERYQHRREQRRGLVRPEPHDVAGRPGA